MGRHHRTDDEATDILAVMDADEPDWRPPGGIKVVTERYITEAPERHSHYETMFRGMEATDPALQKTEPPPQIRPEVEFDSVFGKFSRRSWIVLGAGVIIALAALILAVWLVLHTHGGCAT